MEILGRAIPYRQRDMGKTGKHDDVLQGEWYKLAFFVKPPVDKQKQKALYCIWQRGTLTNMS
jgi:hypothetical protein